MDGINVTTQTLEESIRARPENLMASNVPIEEEHLIADANDPQSLCYETFITSPLMHHLFLEVISNAMDNCERSMRVNVDPGVVKVMMDISTGVISVYNEGLPFSCHFLDELQLYNPHAALFRLLSSTNYDTNDMQRTSAGRNGIGGSSVSLFTEYTKLHIFNAVSGVEYVQVSNDCMRDVSPPTITKYTGTKSNFTFEYKIHFPSVFAGSLGIMAYTDQMQRMLARICMELAMSSSGIPIFFNDVKYLYSTPQSFFDKLIVANATLHDSDVVSNHSNFITIKSPTYSTFAVVYDTPFGGRSIGYVNGIPNPKGGTHVDEILRKIFNVIKDDVNVKKICNKFTSAALSKHISIFVTCRIPTNLIAFDDGQRKQKLRCDSYKPVFNEKCDAAIHAMHSWLAIEAIARINSAKVFKNVNGKKTYFLSSPPEGLNDAEEAGGPNSYRCILNILEGVSTKNTVLKGVNTKYEGVYAVGGKILNTSKCNDDSKDMDQCALEKLANKKIKGIVDSMGFTIGMDYSLDKNMNTLRYHHIRFLTDEDVDGYHIQGLLFNMVRDLFPSLFKRKGFISVGHTPLIKLAGAPKQYADNVFYSVGEYEEWRDSHPSVKHTIKYFKGLGSNSDKDIISAFKMLKSNVYKYDDKADRFMALAFDRHHEDNRKQWISTYNRALVEKYVENDSISLFINTYLMTYNLELVARSIPSICDGLKPSQRKILFTAMHMPAKKCIPSSSFIGNVMSTAGYHHGDGPLYQAIACMISSYMGHNNYPLIVGRGQFGSIAEPSPSSARYTECGGSSNIKRFFSHYDDVLLEYTYDGTMRTEPKYYIPIVPLFALNGGSAIAVGWSTDYPPHKLENVVDWIKVFLLRKFKDDNAIKYPRLVPWYKDYKGIVRLVNAGSDDTSRRQYWVTEGKFMVLPKLNKVEVCGFPVGLTCDAYSRKLEKKVEAYKKAGKKLEYKRCTKNIIEKDGTITIIPNFIIHGLENPTITTLGLRTKVMDTNIKLLNENGRVMSFDSMHDAMMYWCEFRYNLYAKRKEAQISLLKEELDKLNLRANFIRDVMDGVIDITLFRGMKSSEVKAYLKEHNYPEEFMDVRLSEMNKEHHDLVKQKIDKVASNHAYYVNSNVARIWLDDLATL